MRHQSSSRRTFVKNAGGSLAGVMAAPYVMRTSALAATPVTMGCISPYTGAYAYAGPGVEKGMDLILSEHGYKAQGRDITLITRDTETKPAVGVRRLTEAIENEGLEYFGGNFSSSVGLAQSEVAAQHKVLQYAAGGSEDFVGKRCSRYTFQWSANAYTAIKAVMDYTAEKYPDARRWYTITVDYVFGHTLHKYAQLIAEEKGIELVGDDRHPLGERQFNQYLTKVIAAQPDVLCLLNAGSDAVTTVRQFHNFGMAEQIKVVAPWAMEVDQMRELTPRMREGLILGQNYYHDIDTAVNREFVEKFRDKHGGSPSYVNAYGYDSFRTILNAMEEAGSTSPPDVVEAMEGMEFEGILGQARIDPNNHQTVRPYFVVEGKAESEMQYETDYARLVAKGAEPQPAELNECPGLGPL